MVMAADIDIEIDEEFRAAITPLDAEELAQLEANLLEQGCLSPLVVWAGTGKLLDGHNRLDICRRHGIAFDVVEIELDDRVAALLWIIMNQLGRRNLHPFVRVELALKMESLIAAKAKANQGMRTDIPQNSAECPKPIETREVIAKAAGVSHDTVSKVKNILAKATDAVKEKVRKGKVSIDAAYKEARKEESPTEAKAKPAEGGRQGDAPKEFGDRWNAMWDRMLTFFISVPRRGGIVNLVRGWSPDQRERAIAKLDRIAETCGTYAAELRREYTDG